MCFDSYRFQSPEVQNCFIMVRECPCDFHLFSGIAQSGEISEVEQHELVQFHQDGEVDEAEVPATSLAVGMNKNASDDLQNSIVGFLGRPVQLSSFTWASGTGTVGPLWRYGFPAKWLATRMIQEKLQGFQYLKCDLVVEMQINAQPFNAGMGVMWFHPLIEQLAYRTSANNHFGGITGFPCVYYRCGDQTSVKLRIPFQTNLSHIDLTKALGSMGEVAFTILSPLTGAADCDGTVWCWAENVQVEMPTGVPLLFPAPVMSGVAQSGKRDATKAERMSSGPIEATLSTLSGIAASASKVPGLAAVAGVGQSLFSAGASVAGFFGWSKPNNSEPPEQVNIMFAKNMMNSAGSGNAKILSLDPRNATDIPTEVFGTEEDEMSFDVLLKKETYMDRFLFSATDTQNTVLWSWPVHPRSAIKAASQSPYTYYQVFGSLLSYVSHCAARWRGGIVYNLRAVQTAYHSGRLRVTFVPGAVETTNVNTIDFQKCYSVVYDLRESSDMEFTVPYVSNNPWRSTTYNRQTQGPFTASDKCWSTPTGMIYVTVVNALRAPTTAASAIQVLVFNRAAPDFQLAYPLIEDNVKVISKATNVLGAPQSGSAQSGFIKAPNDVSFAANQVAMGEIFTGFRQWLKRSSRITPVAHPDGAIVSPYVWSPNFDQATLALDLLRTITPFSFAGNLYRYQSGPLRLLLSRFAPTLPLTASVAIPTLPTAIEEGNGEPVSVTTTLEPVVEYELPFYQQFPAILTSTGYPFPADCYSVDPANNYHCNPHNEGTSLVVSDAPTAFEAYVSAGETYSLGFQVGPPVLAYVPASTA